MTATLVETPGAKRLSVTLLDGIVTIKESREGFVGWIVESMAGSFTGSVYSSTTDNVFIDPKGKKVWRINDTTHGSHEWQFATDSLTMVVTVDKDLPTERMFMLLDGVSSVEVEQS
jgi:hypothetical protein